MNSVPPIDAHASAEAWAARREASYREEPSRIPGAVRWYSESSVRPQDRRVLPDGCMDLIWCDGELLIAGPDTTAQVAQLVPGGRYAALRFAPGTAPAYLGLPAQELRDQRIPFAEAYPGPLARRIAEGVAAAPEPGAALEEAVLGALHRGEEPDRAATALAVRLRTGAGLAGAAAGLGLSERQLRRRCLAAFGYPAKTLHRILRMQRALALVRGGADVAAAAAHVGYVDQPHLSREVKTLASVPLSALLR